MGSLMVLHLPFACKQLVADAAGKIFYARMGDGMQIQAPLGCKSLATRFADEILLPLMNIHVVRQMMCRQEVLAAHSAPVRPLTYSVCLHVSFENVIRCEFLVTLFARIRSITSVNVKMFLKSRF